MEAAQRAHFFKHGAADVDDATKQQCHFCQIRAMPQQPHFPVTIVNELNDDTLPADFRFVDGYVLRSGVEPAEDSFRSGCDCGQDDAGCRLETCHCLSEVDWDGDGNGNDDDDDNDDDDADDGNDDQGAHAYVSSGERQGLLKSKMLRANRAIYECHSACSCSDKCPNRVVQQGRTLPLQIFRTADRGWGVRSLVAIKKGQFVDRYMGEVVTEAEANRRRDSGPSRRKDIYLFDLDLFQDDDSPDVRLRVPFVVDGEYRSGPTRFVNHSCDPNMRIFARVGDHADKHLHELAFFAIRHIDPGEELTFDYVNGGTAVGEPEMVCLCGSKNCRGYLF